MNGLCIQWERNKTISNTSTLQNFPLSAQFTQTPAFIPTPHKNANDAVQIDMLGYYVEKTGFKCDFLTGSTIDYIAIGY